MEGEAFVRNPLLFRCLLSFQVLVDKLVVVFGEFWLFRKGRCTCQSFSATQMPGSSYRYRPIFQMEAARLKALDSPPFDGLYVRTAGSVTFW